LLSRCHVFVLEPLKPPDIAKILLRAVKHYESNKKKISLSKDAAKYICTIANGDARRAIEIVSIAAEVNDKISLDLVQQIAPSKYYRYSPDLKYDLASWCQGAIQASDPDSAIYALARWLESGEDPRYIARRLLISASEDASGNPEVAAIANNAYVAACKIGRPECDIILAHAVVAIATAPRNKSAAKAIWAAVADVKKGEIIEVPKEMRDCHYPGAAELGHGDYHDGANPKAYVGINKKYYHPK
jgi:putative ATPase